MLALSSPKSAVTVSIIAVVLGPGDTKRAQGCTVKRISNGAENWDVADDFGQQNRLRLGAKRSVADSVAKRQAPPPIQFNSFG
jgi:hypothetical protein